MISEDGWGLRFPESCLTVEKKNRKNLNQENWPDHGSNPSPLGEKQRRYPSTIPVVNVILILVHACIYFNLYPLGITGKKCSIITGDHN